MRSSTSSGRSKKERIFEIIQIAGSTDAASRTFDRCIIFLILLSIVITTAQTFPLPDAAAGILNVLDAVCMIAFTAEYALRLWTADLLYPSGSHPYLRFVFSPAAVIDLFSILPFYLSGLVPAGMVVFRLIRVARILRLFRINRYLDPVAAILAVLKQKASLIFASWFLVFVLMFSSSLLLYYAEHEAQPTIFENAFSGLWWAVSTLSTTGYGDIYPVTFLGRTLAIFITLLGMCIVALPTGILTAGFMEAAQYTDPVSRSDKALPSPSGTILDISTQNTTILAPLLIDPEQSSIEQIPLPFFIGPCIVETVSGEVNAEKIGAIISKAPGEASRRILLRGELSLTEEAARFMAQFGILIAGFSQSSDNGRLLTRTLLAGHVIPLTGLDLSSIDDGIYQLNAAPVFAPGASSAACRACLTRITALT